MDTIEQGLSKHIVTYILTSSSLCVSASSSIKRIARHPSQTQGWGTIDGPSAPRQSRSQPGMSLMQEEVMQSIQAQKQKLIMHEQTSAARSGANGREGGVAGASLPPRTGLNARESERKQTARDGGVNIWNDIAGEVKQKVQAAAATVEKTISGSSP